jgi:4-hydroxyproline epimerase
MISRIHIIDSHTGGEPTRVVVSGGPDLGTGPMAERLDRFQNRFDHIRSAVVNEPRGNDAIVGALLCEPSDASYDAGVIFFNNVGYLNMCGHGTIGLVVTLKHLGRIAGGTCRLETVCGPVEARLLDENRVTIRNVASYRSAAQVAVEAPGIGRVHGDIAWGGNWFFLVGGHGLPLTLGHLEELTDYAWRVRQGLEAQGIRGADGREIDHIELIGPPAAPGADGKNFVLCPGKAYDRSPCGTGWG